MAPQHEVAWQELNPPGHRQSENMKLDCHAAGLDRLSSQFAIPILTDCKDRERANAASLHLASQARRNHARVASNRNQLRRCDWSIRFSRRLAMATSPSPLSQGVWTARMLRVKVFSSTRSLLNISAGVTKSVSLSRRRCNRATIDGSIVVSFFHLKTSIGGNDSKDHGAIS